MGKFEDENSEFHRCSQDGFSLNPNESDDLIGTPVFTRDELNWIQYALLSSMNNRRKFGYEIPEQMASAEGKINDVLDELDGHSFDQYMDSCRMDDPELPSCPDNCPNCD